MTLWLRLLSLCACILVYRADDKLDNLFPYKFVRPMFGVFSETEAETSFEDTAEVAIAEARSGEAAPTGGDETEVDDIDQSVMLALESKPKAEALVDMRSRARKRVEAKVAKVESESKRKTKEAVEDVEEEEKVTITSNEKAEERSIPSDKISDRISNHKLEEKQPSAESRSSSKHRYRIPPRPEDEYYYYYDDEYYYYDEYYDDYERPDVGRYPNFPSKPPRSKPVYPTKESQSVKKPEFTKPKYPTKDPYPKEKDEIPLKSFDYPKKTNDPRKRPSVPERKPQSTRKHSEDVELEKEERYNKNRKKEKKTGYGIESTLKRLKEEKKSVYSIQSTLDRLAYLRNREKYVERAGKPSLPNPWPLFKPDTSLVPPALIDRRPLLPNFFKDPPLDPGRRRNEESGVNPLALLVAPLAGIALLTAAAAVAINPVLVTASLTGKRRKRGADTLPEFEDGISPELEEKIHEMQVLERFMSAIPDNQHYQNQVLSMYLSCSGYTEVGNSCMDRVVCEYADNSSEVTEEERDVISIVLYNIMSNEFVNEEFKERLRQAAKHGRDQGKCLVYECEELKRLTDNTL